MGYIFLLHIVIHEKNIFYGLSVKEDFLIIVNNFHIIQEIYKGGDILMGKGWIEKILSV